MQKPIDLIQITTDRPDYGKKILKIIEKGDWVLSVQRFRDIHNSPFIEAICEHGVGHHKGVHGCDGCCKHMPKDMFKKVSKD